jgi:hypothetical protein
LDKKAISISELKRLLYDLRDKQPYTCIRFRLIGELWQQNFMQIFNLGEEEAIFFDEPVRRLIRISDLSTIMQFELDHNFQQYLALFHYDLCLDEKYAEH